jgi:hypothetical protein
MTDDGRATVIWRAWPHELQWARWAPALPALVGARLGTGKGLSAAGFGEDGLVAAWQDGEPEPLGRDGPIVAAELSPGAAAFGEPVQLGVGNGQNAHLATKGMTATYTWVSSPAGLEQTLHVARRDASGWSLLTNLSLGRPSWHSVFVEPDGDVHAVWDEWLTAEPRNPSWRRYDARGGFWKEAASPWVAAPQSLTWQTLAGGPNGHAVFVVEFAPGEVACNVNGGVCEAHVMHHDPAADAWSDIGTLETFGSTIGSVQAVVHGSGSAAVSWSAHDGNPLGWTRFVSFYEATSGRWSEPLSVVTGAPAGQLHMDADGNVWFLWMADSRMSGRRWTCGSR